MARTQLGGFQVRDEDFMSEVEAATMSGTLQSQIDAKPDTLLELTDTPSSYDDGKYLRSTASGTEWNTVAATGGGGLTWTIISGSTTAQDGYGYLIDASNNDVILSMPSSPAVGNMVGFCDYKSSALANVITISGSGENIEGSSENLIVDVVGAAGTFVYTDATRGWELVTEIGNFTQTTFNYQNLVNRGDPSAYDFTLASFTTDNVWRDFDLSSIVPNNAVAVVLRVMIEDDAAQNWIRFRKNGNSYDLHGQVIRIQLANVPIEDTLIVPCDSNQIIEYQTANTTYTTINVVVQGWFTEDDQVAVGAGNVYAPEALTDNYLIRGDGGQKNVQVSTVQVSDDGEMTNTSQPCFSVYPSAEQTNIAVGGPVTIIFGSERFDVGNNFASNTFTAPVTGKYQLNAQVRAHYLDSASTFYYLRIYTTKASYTDILDPARFSADVTYWTFKISALADMDQGDTAYVVLYQATGTQQTDISTDSSFSGFLVC